MDEREQILRDNLAFFCQVQADEGCRYLIVGGDFNIKLDKFKGVDANNNCLTSNGLDLFYPKLDKRHHRCGKVRNIQIYLNVRKQQSGAILGKKAEILNILSNIKHYIFLNDYEKNE
jgi:hypothetical protein